MGSSSIVDVLAHSSKDVNGERKIHGETGRKFGHSMAGRSIEQSLKPLSGSAYSNLVSAEPDLAATTAGAITIPIKARAIRTSCMGAVSSVGVLWNISTPR
jgi:hypothetical protein